MRKSQQNDSKRRAAMLTRRRHPARNTNGFYGELARSVFRALRELNEMLAKEEIDARAPQPPQERDELPGL